MAIDNRAILIGAEPGAKGQATKFEVVRSMSDKIQIVVAPTN
ncbi:MAG TPA: hypothetical protein VEW46_08025 [Pyrinomonadaceae bacterium]|nr:hypothetical protein [Pyrinomonadaceae bacterium]